MPTPVTDPSILAQLEAGPKPVTDPAILAQLEGDRPSTAEDVGRSILSRGTRGVLGLAGLASDVTELGAQGINAATQFIGNKLGVDVGPSRKPVEKPTLGQQHLIELTEKGLGGKLYEPQTTAGHYAGSAAEFLPGSVLGPGGMLAKALRFGVAPGVAAEAGGRFAKEIAGEEYEPYARTAAALGTMAVNPSRLITPNPMTPQRQAMVNVLEGEGVTRLTAGQRTGNKRLQYAEATAADTPLSGSPLAQEINQTQAEQFTKAALKRIGEDSDRITPEVANRFFDRNGKQFDTIAARNSAQIDTQFANDARQVATDFLHETGAASPFLEAQIQKIANSAAHNGGVLTGEAYKGFRSDLERVARGTTNSELQFAIRDLRGALDDLMARNISKADKAGWEEARRQYRNMLVIERAATGAGSATAEGLISPSALRNATVQVHGRRNYFRGRGDFEELARAGEAVMKPLPQSGTGPRTAVTQNIISGLAGGGFGLASGGGIGSAIGGAALGLAAPAVASKVAMSPLFQRYMANQLLQGGAAPAGQQRRLLAAQLMAQPQLQSPQPLQ